MNHRFIPRVALLVCLMVSVVALASILSGCGRYAKNALSYDPSSERIDDMREVRKGVDDPDTEVGSAEEAGGKSASDMAKVAQNPVSNIYNFPFQNNTNFKVGPNEATNNTLNIQPVIPVTVGQVNLINRAIIPVQWQGEVVAGNGSKSGLGDITYEAPLSPAKPGKVIWGIGPALIFPTATDDRLGTGKWQAGAVGVVLTMPGDWVVGALAQNTWSFAGDEERADVNFFFSQYFINYNLPDGWYLTSSPIITANWEAASGEEWTVPFGGGFGKVHHIGKLPTNFQIQAFYNVEKPEFGADWQLRLQIQPMVPKAMLHK